MTFTLQWAPDTFAVYLGHINHVTQYTLIFTVTDFPTENKRRQLGEKEKKERKRPFFIAFNALGNKIELVV